MAEVLPSLFSKVIISNFYKRWNFAMVNASLSYFCFIDVKLNSNLGRSLRFENRKGVCLFVCLKPAEKALSGGQSAPAAGTPIHVPDSSILSITNPLSLNLILCSKLSYILNQ